MSRPPCHREKRISAMWTGDTCWKWEVCLRGAGSPLTPGESGETLTGKAVYRFSPRAMIQVYDRLSHVAAPTLDSWRDTELLQER